MYDYEEACPISHASSVLGERWTLQIIREMLFGASRFTDFQKYLPRLSPTLLNSRLRSLEEAGIVIKKRISGQRGYEYLLSPSGQALAPVLREIGKWGIHWVFDSMDPSQLNVAALVRDFAVSLNLDQLPSGDTHIQFNILRDDDRHVSFVSVREGRSQVCDVDPGHEVDIYLTATAETFGNIWYGNISIEKAIRTKALTVAGNKFYVQRLSRWLGTSKIAQAAKEA